MTARRGSIALGLVLMFVVAPLLWFAVSGGFIGSVAVGFGLIVLALVVAGAGFGLFIYGLIAKRDLERAFARQARVANETAPNPEPQGKYCPDCGTVNSPEASVCVSCGVQFPAGWPRPPWG